MDAARDPWPPGGWTGGRYSLFRVCLGLYLTAMLAALAASAAPSLRVEPGLSLGIPPDTPFNLFGWSSAPLYLRGLVGSAAAAALLLVLGLFDRPAAALLFVVWSSVLGWDAHLL
ncbi:MAG: hypothetical protein D6729_04600, partial [Deltaproteobacteria bacterium]